MILSKPKIFLSIFLILSFFIIIAGRLFYLQVLNGEKYLRFADSYAVKEIPIVPSRGRIYDRNGVLLATTRPAFNLLLHLQRVHDLDGLLKEIAPVVSMDPKSLKENLASSKELPRFRPLPLLSDMTRDQLARLKMYQSLNLAEDERKDRSALELQVEPIRKYEKGDTLGNIIGFIREISEEKLADLQKNYPDVYRLGDLMGVQGLERKYDLQLRGKKGTRELIVDALGHEVREDVLGLNKELTDSPPVGGTTFHLTIDSRLQEVAFHTLDASHHNGAVVVLDVRTGEILAIVSRPSYDGEKLHSKDAKEYWMKMNFDPDKPLLNRAYQGGYPPGSTFKIVTGLAALTEGIIKPHDTISCPGYYMSGNRRFGCWRASGHGSVNFYKALVQSCDVYFYRVSEKLGVDKIAYYAKLLGLGQQTGIDLDFERRGLIPTTEWKLKARKEEWRPSETLSVAIGQGYNIVTPLQNALMIARVANRGLLIQPHLVKEIEFPDGTRKSLFSTSDKKIELDNRDDRIWSTLHEALIGVVQDPSGTAHRIALPGIQMGGKTGTAQVVNYDTYGRKAQSKKTEDHAWFVAFAPADKPEIAVSVIVEHGGHGGTAAAPIAKEVIEKYLEFYHQYKKELVNKKGEKQNLILQNNPAEGD